MTDDKNTPLETKRASKKTSSVEKATNGLSQKPQELATQNTFTNQILNQDKNSTAPREKTKSQQKLDEIKQEDTQKQDKLSLTNTLADTLKNNIGSWNGSVGGDKEGDLNETAGLAAGGPVYAAMQEIKGVIEDDKEDNSLLGAIKKTVADKTGLTAVTDKISEYKESTESKIYEWAGAEKKQETSGKRDSKGRFLPAEKKQELNGKRDNKGRFISAENFAEKKAQLIISKKQVDIAERQFDFEQKEAKQGDKDHKDLMRSIKSLGGGGGLFGEDGLFDGFGDNEKKGKKGRNRRGRRGRSEGKKQGLLKRMGKGLGRGVGKGASLLGGMVGIGSIGGMFGGTTPPLPSVPPAPVSRTASRVTTSGANSGAAKGAGKLSAKALGGAARAIPVIGQVLAIGMAAYDAVDGFTDKELHKEAFELEEGQEASTGQKTSAALANTLDMGGLLTGAASFVTGSDVSTADIASGIYDAADAIASVGTGIASFFGFGDEKESGKKETKEAEIKEAEIKKALPVNQGITGIIDFDEPIVNKGNVTSKNNVNSKAKEEKALPKNTATAVAVSGMGIAGIIDFDDVPKESQTKETVSETPQISEAKIADIGKDSTIEGEITTVFGSLLDGIKDLIDALKIGEFGESSLGGAISNITYQVSGGLVGSSGVASSPIDKEKHEKRVKSATENKGAVASVAAGMSESLNAGTQNAIDNKVSYRMGGKNSAQGQIDCSGWVSEQSRLMMESVNTALGEEVFSKDVQKTLKVGHAQGGAAGLISAGERLSGEQIGTQDLTPEQVTEGMMIGISGGKHARGRHKDIGHIVQTFRDSETGEMMVSESTSNRQGQDGKASGVREMPYDEWWELNKKKQMHGVDLMGLADVSNLPKEAENNSLIADAQQNTANQALTANSVQNTTQNAQGMPSVQAQPISRIPEVQSVGNIASPQSLQSSSNTFSSPNIEALLLKLIAAVERTSNGNSSGNNNSDRKNGHDSSGSLDIPVNFASAYSNGVALDTF